MSPSTEKKAGPEKSSGPAFLLIGNLGKTHGVHGEMDLQIYTDFPERLKHGKKVYLGQDKKPIVLDTVRPANKVLLVSFEGYNSPEEARLLTNLEVFVKTAEIPPLPDGSYYHHELIGLRVFEGDIFLGEITEILETGANDVLVVKQTDAPELLLPDIPDVVLDVNLDEGLMRVNVLDGLRDGRP
ncbi:MAG TPA: ribosome maturation factor RimM [Anaerolineaceae bacterium]|nr:ribosome maturation factor RimM [Anaerolineaceae bacterium]